MNEELHQRFVKAIHSKRKIKLTFITENDGITQVRHCVPYDQSISNGKMKYHFWDISGSKGNQVLSIDGYQIHDIEILFENFDPGNYINWPYMNWTIRRDWGKYS